MKRQSVLRSEPAPRRVPPARIEFLAEDRAWIVERIDEVLASGQLTLGKYGVEFEEKFAAFCGTRHAIAVSSGTSALEIILRVLGVSGKDVVVPANSFFATAAAVVHAGGRPVFVDMDPGSFGVRPGDVRAALTPKTVAVIVVHVAGLVSHHLPALQELTRQAGIALIEDAAHAHGSSFHGVMAGHFGIAGAFSFYPTKVMTSAEGGMITTDDDRIVDEARIYRDQGKASFNQNAHTRMGYNWRMSEPHAIIGLRHLQRLPAMIAARQRIAAIYDRGLADFAHLSPLTAPEGGVSNYYKYTAVLSAARDRKRLKSLLWEQYGVQLAGEVYEQPLHKQPIFAEYATGPLPAAEAYCAEHVCLPIFSGMDDADTYQVLDALKAVLPEGA